MKESKLLLLFLATPLLLIPLFTDSFAQEQHVTFGVIFNDTFSRTVSTTVGNGWIETETAANDIEIVAAPVLDQHFVGNYMSLEGTGETNLPRVRHETTQQFDGILTWEFEINLVNSGDSTYQVYMQLGDRDAFDDGTLNLQNDVYVSLVWAGSGGGFAQDDNGFGYIDQAGNFEQLTTVEGVISILVKADLDNEEYTLQLFSEEDVDSMNPPLQTFEHIPFRETIGANDLSAMRFVLNSQANDIGVDNISLNDISVENNLKQVIQFTGTYTGGASSRDFTISPSLTNISKAISFVSFKHTSADSHNTIKGWDIINTNTLRIYGGQNTPLTVDAVDFSATIFEFTNDDDPVEPSDMHVFHETESIAASQPEGEFTFTTPSDFFSAETTVLLSGHSELGADGTLGIEELARVRVDDGCGGFCNDWDYQVGDTPNSGRTVYAQVVYWNEDNIWVDGGSGTLTDPSNTVDTITITPDYNRQFFADNSLVFVTFQSDDGTTAAPNQNTISAHLNTNNELIIQRYNSATDTLSYHWQIVMFPEGLVTIQHGTLSMTSGASIGQMDITPVDLTKSGVFGTVGTPFGYGFCRVDTSTAGAFDRATVAWSFVDSNTIQAQRSDSTGALTCGWQVVEITGFIESPDDVTMFDPYQGLVTQPSCCFFFINQIIDLFKSIWAGCILLINSLMVLMVWS